MTPALLPLGLFVLLVAIWLIFRGPGYKRTPLERPPGPDWEKTAERFIDPRTGVLIEVWFHPASGARAYVRAAGEPGRSSFS